MPSEPLQLSEARRRLSALVERVAQGGSPIAIGRYGRERAVLVGAEEYARLAKRARPRPASPQTIEGTLTLTCSPAELTAEHRRLGELWLAAPEEGSSAPRRGPMRRRRRPGA
jgi:prevent-host-death family protein